MRPLFKPVHGLGVLACIAAVAGILALTLPGNGNAEDKPAPQAESQPVALQTPAAPDKPEPKPEEYVSPPVEESAWQVGNLSVLDLVDGALKARERNDLAYLARCMESTADKPSLVEEDTLAAHRQFTWRSTDPAWNKILQSWAERSYEVVETGDTAELVMQVGGNLGEMRLRFVRHGDHWYFAGI